MIPLLLSLLIGISISWFLFLLTRTMQQQWLWAKWFGSFQSAHLESLTFVWNRGLISWSSPLFKKMNFKNLEMAAWNFWLGIESALLFSLFFGFEWKTAFFGGCLGACYPSLWRWRQKKKRRLAIKKDLPFVIDLLAISTQAGLDMMQAIQRMVQALPTTPLIDEFKKMLDDLKLGRSRREVLEAFKTRVELLEVSHFVSLLLQAIQLGSPLAQVLIATSQQMRESRFQQAERSGHQAAIKILFPLIFCILPSVFLLIFAPLGLRLMTEGWKGILW